MADGMPGMPWKEALKRLKEHHAAGLDGSPATMQKELEGLEESLKGWETRDERRERSLEIYRQADEKLRAENDKLRGDISKLVSCCCNEDAGGLRIPFDPGCPQHSVVVCNKLQAENESLGKQLTIIRDALRALAM